MRRLAHIACGLTVLLAGADSGPASGNMVPYIEMVIHVQPRPHPPVDYCVSPPVSHCNQIVSWTQDDGLLEFDLFVHPYYDWPPNPIIHQLQVDLNWPDTWDLAGC